MLEITVLSSAFTMGAAIPPRYSCEGQDISPPLEWQGIPANTESIAVLCDDPDAPVGDWVHWVLFNLPPDITGLPEAVPAHRHLDNGAVQGLNDFRRTGYGGPCPPSGTHRYVFKVFALDTMLTLGPETTKQMLLEAMKGHILGQGALTGNFTR